MSSYVVRMQDQLLNLLGAQKRRTFGEALLGTVLPAAAGMFVGGALGLALAPKAGHLLRQDIQKWLDAARTQDAKTTFNKTLDAVRSAEAGGDAADNDHPHGNGRMTR